MRKITRYIDVDESLNRLGWLDEYDRILYAEVKRCIDSTPTANAVPKDMIFHIDTYDEMTEEYSKEELTLEEILDKFTDEGCPWMEDEE